MKKSELFDAVLGKVCDVCEVEEDALLSSCKNQDLVDARMLLVHYLKKLGLSNDEIAKIYLCRSVGTTGLLPTTVAVKSKSKSIDRLFNSYVERCRESMIFGLMSSDVRTYCDEITK